MGCVETGTFGCLTRLTVMALGRSVAACLLMPLALSACAAFSRSPTGQTDSSSGAPSPRAGAAMAFDPAASQLVMFGGGAFVSLDETWTWDGVAWSLLSR
jgi:hypothetical protein